MMRGLGERIRAAFGRGERRPVAANVYRLNRQLRARGAIALDEIEAQLPARIE